MFLATVRTPRPKCSGSRKNVAVSVRLSPHGTQNRSSSPYLVDIFVNEGCVHAGPWIQPGDAMLFVCVVGAFVFLLFVLFCFRFLLVFYVVLCVCCFVVLCCFCVLFVLLVLCVFVFVYIVVICFC